MEEAKRLNTIQDGPTTIVGQLLEPFASGLGIRITASSMAGQDDIFEDKDHVNIDCHHSHHSLQETSPQSAYYIPTSSFSSIKDDHDVQHPDASKDNEKVIINSNRSSQSQSIDVPRIDDNYLPVTRNDSPVAEPITLKKSNNDFVSEHLRNLNEREHEMPLTCTKIPLETSLSIDKYPPIGSKVYAIPFGAVQYMPCVVLDLRHFKSEVHYKVLFSDLQLIRSRRKKQWIDQKNVQISVGQRTAPIIYYSRILKPIVTVRNLK
jgi:hypothetical protein